MRDALVKEVSRVDLEQRSQRTKIEEMQRMLMQLQKEVRDLKEREEAR